MSAICVATIAMPAGRLAAAIVDTHALLQLVYVALLAGVGVCLVYAVAVVGISRSADRRRANRRGAALLYGALSLLAIAACVVAIAIGIVVMTQK